MQSLKSFSNAAAASAFALLMAFPATAQTVPDFVDISFTGTVTKAGNDVITARNPDGSVTTLSGSQIPDYRYAPGDPMVTTYRFLTDQPSFSNTGCGGRFTLGFAQQASGGCFAELASVNTPFGRVGMGGFGGDASPTVTGLELVRDSNGGYSIDMPTGTYTMSYVGINPFRYDSATGTLSSPTNNVCIDAFSCPTGVITGTPTGWTAPIGIVGNFGQNGVNGGYNAGSAGLFSVFGSFRPSGGSTGGATDVPEPGTLLLFAGGVGALALRRRRRNVTK